MKQLQNILMILAGVVALGIAYLTGKGTILEYIHFADPLNELGFFCANVTLGGMLLYCGFSTEK